MDMIHGEITPQHQSVSDHITVKILYHSLTTPHVNHFPIIPQSKKSQPHTPITFLSHHNHKKTQRHDTTHLFYQTAVKKITASRHHILITFLSHHNQKNHSLTAPHTHHFPITPESKLTASRHHPSLSYHTTVQNAASYPHDTAHRLLSYHS